MLSFAALAATLTLQTALAADPLFDKMTGNWMGEGERVQLGSGHRIRIQTHTIGTMQGDSRLVSRNEITETDESGHIRTYLRDYWMRPNSATAGVYDLGAGGSEEKATSQGRFDGSILEVVQDLGGSPAYVVRSRTRFDSQGSFYEEHAWFGDHELSQTRIRYHR